MLRNVAKCTQYINSVNLCKFLKIKIQQKSRTRLIFLIWVRAVHSANLRYTIIFDGCEVFRFYMYISCWYILQLQYWYKFSEATCNKYHYVLYFLLRLLEYFIENDLCMHLLKLWRPNSKIGLNYPSGNHIRVNLQNLNYHKPFVPFNLINNIFQTGEVS